MSDPSADPRPITPHPFAEIFPPMSDEEREGLEKSIKRNGLRDKIMIDSQNRILDGLNRYRACLAVGVAPEFQVFEGTEDEAGDLIWDRNIVRRQLSTSAKAAVGADWTELKRGQHKSGNSQISVAEAAKQLGISESSIHVEKAVKRASPELHAAVKADKASINVAEGAAKLPEKVRAETIKQIVAAPNKKDARAKAKAANSAHVRRSSPASPSPGNHIHAAYAALFEELDQLPRLLDEHPLSLEHLEELVADLRRALEVAVETQHSQLAELDDKNAATEPKPE